MVLWLSWMVFAIGRAPPAMAIEKETNSRTIFGGASICLEPVFSRGDEDQKGKQSIGGVPNIEHMDVSQNTGSNDDVSLGFPFRLQKREPSKKDAQ